MSNAGILDQTKLLSIIIDTREQLPYSFNPQRVRAIRRALPAGDYSIEGMETKVAVERKSLDDFAQTVIKNRNRFHAELKKLQTYDFACVIVEADLRDIVRGNYTSGASPESILGNLTSICAEWGIPVYCCSSRQLAIVFVEQWLEKVGRKMRRIMERMNNCEKN